MKHLVALVLAAALLASCTEPRPAASTATATATASATAPTVTVVPTEVRALPTAAAPTTVASPASTATAPASGGATVALPRGWDRQPSSGIALVDTVVAAVVARDATALARRMTGHPMPCGLEPECPPGVAAGTLVR